MREERWGVTDGGQHNINMEQQRNISFAGCGFIGIYHVGVSACLQLYASHLLQNKIGGSSAGAMVALALASGNISLQEMTRKVAMLAYEASNKPLGPFSPTFNLHQLLATYLADSLPVDVAEKVSGRLFVSLTKASNKGNLLVSNFRSKTDLIDAVCASSFVPIMSGWTPPRFRGEIALDGGYSDNIPLLGDVTLTVSPFAGDASICPQDDTTANVFFRVPHGSGGCVDLSRENINKLMKAMMPPDTTGMEALCCQGFEDAKKYLMKEKMIRCKKCSRNQLSENCHDCTALIQEAKTKTLPKEMVQVFEEIRELEYQKPRTGVRAYFVNFYSKCFCTLTFTLIPTMKLKGFRPTIESCPFVNL